MRVGSTIRARALAEMARFEALRDQKPGQRLLLWTGKPSAALSGEEFGNEAGPGENRGGRIELGRHHWVVRIECDFSAAPGNYLIEYLSDPWGLTPPDPNLDTGTNWNFLAAGRSVSECRLTGKLSLWRPESEQESWHGQPALFMRAVRVTTENVVTVTHWHVWEDTGIDLSSYLRDSVTVTRKQEGRKDGKFVRSECDFVLADPEGCFIEQNTPKWVEGIQNPLRDENGLTYLRALSRWTLELSYAGGEWERPEGFEGSGWWPHFGGYLRRRSWERGETATLLHVSLRAGCKATDQKTTQPLHERMTADEFLRKWATVADDRQRRLIGVGEKLERWATSYEEYVGKTRIFGDNWWESVLQLDPPERIHAICSTGMNLVALIFTAGIGGGNTEQSYMNPQAFELVRYDFGGQVVERVYVHRQGSPADFPLTWFHDLTYVDGWIIVTAQRNDVPGSPGVLLFFEESNLSAGYVDHHLLQGTYDYPNIPTKLATAICGVNSPHYGTATFLVAQVEEHAPGWHFNLYQYLNGHLVDRGASLAGGVGAVPRTMEAFDTGVGGTLLFICGQMPPDVRPGASMVWPYDEPALARFGVGYASGGFWPLAIHFGENSWREAGNRYTSLCKQGDYVLAAGFGPESIQGIAKVAKLGWYLENALIWVGTQPKVNFAEPRFRIGSQVLEGSDYSLDAAGGHIGLLFLPEDGLDVRASYDYQPSWGLVKISEEMRWDLAGEVAWGSGLVLWIDPFDRLCWEERELEEVFVAGTGKTWKLGSTRSADGLPWIVPETIAIGESTAAGSTVDPNLYSLTYADFVTPDGQSALIWTLAVVGELDETAWRIRFCVQQTIWELDGASLSFAGETDADRVITKAVVTSERRVASDFPQRIEQAFAVAPEQTELSSRFDRLKPVQGSAVFDWRPTEKIYEQSATEETPVFDVAFDQPLILGTSRYGVEYGETPVLLTVAVNQGNFTGSDSDCRFLKVTFAPEVTGEYNLWIQYPGSYRVAKPEEFDSFAGHTAGGTGFEPADAMAVRNGRQFYIFKMNDLETRDCRVIAYKKSVRWYGQDAEGRIVTPPPVNGEGNDARFATAYPEKAALVMLRPQDANNQPLFFENPLAGVAEDAGNEARLVIERVELASDGLRVDLRHFARRQNWLVVEVIGYPASAPEQYLGLAKDAEGIEMYGEQESRFTNRFAVNQGLAQRQAERALDRRKGEPVRYKVSRPLMALMREGDLVRVITPVPGSSPANTGESRLLRIATAVDTLAEKSGTTVECE